MTSRKEIRLLLSILLVATLVRTWGIQFGLPYEYNPDEPFVVTHALKFGTGDLNPHEFQYPTLYMYLLFFLYSLYYILGLVLGLFRSSADFAVQYFVDPTLFYLIGRFTSVVFGTLTVLVTYALAKRAYGKQVALLSCLFLTWTFLHVQQSQYVTPDVPMTFFLILSFYFSTLILEKGKLKHYIYAGLFTGLAAATKYNAAFGIILIWGAHILRVTEEKGSLKTAFTHKRIIVGTGFALIGFLVGCPFAVLDLENFIRYLIAIHTQSNIAWLGQESMANPWLLVLTVYLKDGMGVFLEVLSLSGIGYLLFLHNRRDLLIAAFPVAYYLLMGHFQNNWARYWVPILPVLTITAARLLAAIMHRVSWPQGLKGYAILFAGILVILPSGLDIIKNDYLISQKDTRTIAKEWVEENIPSGSRIALENYGPPLIASKQSLLEALNQSGEAERGKSSGSAVFAVVPFAPSATQGRYLLMAVEKLSISSRTYHIYKTFSLGQKSLDYYIENGYALLITDSWMYERYLAAEKRFPSMAQFYKSLFGQGNLLKEFQPDPLTRPGPVIKIFRLNHR